MAKNEDPIDVSKVREDEKKVNNAGKSGDPIVDGLKKLFDDRTKGKK
jgi:hypothetical protein